MGVKFGTEMPNFTPLVQRVAPAGEKHQNRPLSKLNTGALRCAMLPVKIAVWAPSHNFVELYLRN